MGRRKEGKEGEEGRSKKREKLIDLLTIGRLQSKNVTFLNSICFRQRTHCCVVKSNQKALNPFFQRYTSFIVSHS